MSFSLIVIILFSFGFFYILNSYLDIKTQYSALMDCYFNMIKEYNKLQYLYENFRKTDLKNNTITINKEIIDAINYARKVSHPDNGGDSEHFQKYNKLYNKIKEQHL